MKKTIFLLVCLIAFNSTSMFGQNYNVDTWYEVSMSSATLYNSCISNDDPTCWTGLITTDKGTSNPYGNASPAGSFYGIQSNYNDTTWDGISNGYVTEWVGTPGVTNPIRPSKLKFRVPGNLVPEGTCKTFYIWEIACNYQQTCRFTFPSPRSITVCNQGNSIDCITAALSVSDGLNCITFTRVNTSCPLCYCVKIKFTDNTTTSFNLNFGSGDILKNCFAKTISNVVSINSSSNCGGCAANVTFKQAEEVPMDKFEVNLVQKDRITVSPNPTKSIIKFEGTDLNKYQISIFDEKGKEIKINSKIDNAISLEKEKKGIYIYVITDESGYKQKGKIIKE
ncbi:putative secreted protein (Por secretion system target) [Flavobacterium araucananum]|nr:T9SS type A sorting domain-containing protein [Flavobacterium araucananum]PWJ97254.1 putative secreted protein (Por secretion system target) [Flavobacterium araucananum]